MAIRRSINSNTLSQWLYRPQPVSVYISFFKANEARYGGQIHGRRFVHVCVRVMLTFSQSRIDFLKDCTRSDSGESVDGIIEMDPSDWSNGIRYHVFDTRPELSLNPKSGDMGHRADRSKHVDMSYPRIIRLHAWVIRLRFLYGAAKMFLCTGAGCICVYSVAPRVSRSHGAF